MAVVGTVTGQSHGLLMCLAHDVWPLCLQIFGVGNQLEAYGC